MMYERLVNITIRKNKLKLLVWQIVSIVGLNLAYVFVISDRFHYMGFNYEFNAYKFLICTVISLLILLIGITIKDEFICSVWHIIFLYFFCGEIIFYQYNPNSSFIIPSLVLICLLFVYFISNLNIKLKPPRQLKNNERIITFISIIMFLPFLFFYYRYINIKNLILIDVYQTRQLFREISNQFTGYLYEPLSRILLPMLIIVYLNKGKKIKSIIFLFMILYLYLCGALKSVFIGLLALLFFYKGDYITKVIRFSKAISFLTIFGLLLTTIYNNVFLLDIFIRRVFFIPPYLNNIYVDYFRDNYTFLSHSPLGLGIVDYKYDRNLSMYVGEVVLGKPGLNANVGLLTEGYVSFGFLGGILFALLISLIILYFKMINLDKKYFGILFVYIYYFNTSFLSTLMLTHGLLFLILFSYFFLREREKGNVNRKSTIQQKKEYSLFHTSLKY